MVLKDRSTNTIFALLWALSMLFSIIPISICDQVQAGTPVYLNGDQVTVKVYPTGSFSVNPMEFPSRLSDTSSSFWSFNIDGKVTTTYNPLTVDHVVTPPRKDADGSLKVQYILENEVLIDISYREAGPAAWITVTMENVGPNPHIVGLRHLYDMSGKTLLPSGQNPITNEVTLNPPIIESVDANEGSTRLGVVAFGPAFGATMPTRVTIGAWATTWNTNWDYKVNTSKAVGNEPTLILYWDSMSLPVKGAVKVEHAFGGGAPSHAVKAYDLVVEKLTADPQEQYVGKTRTMKATVKNQGPAADKVEISFIITDDSGKYVANGSVSRSFASGESSDIIWSYDVKKTMEYTAYVFVDPSQDAAPLDNWGKASIIARPSPYKVYMKFADETKIDYISINSGETAVSNFIVQNQGTVEDNITFALSTYPKEWTVSFDISTAKLGPGAATTVKVAIKTIKDNKYYNYALDVVGKSQGSGVTDKVMLFISFADIIAKGGGDPGVGGNHTDPPPKPKPNNNGTIPDITEPLREGLTLTGTQVAVIFIMFGVAFVGAVAVYQIFLMRSKVGLKGILKDFYKKLYDANTSDAYRKAIFEAYKKMCEEIAEYGPERGETLTPKEFEKEIRNHLPVDKRNLHILTKLFEEARYSDHAFNEAKKKQALQALEKIIASLENVTTFEEVKETKWLKKNT